MVLAYHRISRSLLSGGSLLLKNDQRKERKKPIFNDQNQLAPDQITEVKKQASKLAKTPKSVQVIYYQIKAIQ